MPLAKNNACILTGLGAAYQNLHLLIFLFSTIKCRQREEDRFDLRQKANRPGDADAGEGESHNRRYRAPICRWILPESEEGVRRIRQHWPKYHPHRCRYHSVSHEAGKVPRQLRRGAPLKAGITRDLAVPKNGSKSRRECSCVQKMISSPASSFRKSKVQTNHQSSHCGEWICRGEGSPNLTTLACTGWLIRSVTYCWYDLNLRSSHGWWAHSSCQLDESPKIGFENL